MTCVQELVHEHQVLLPRRWSLDKSDNVAESKTVTFAVLPYQEDGEDVKAFCTASFAYTLHRFSMQDTVGVACVVSQESTSDNVCGIQMLKIDFNKATTFKDVVSGIEEFMRINGEGGGFYESDTKPQPLSNVGICYRPLGGSPHATKHVDFAGHFDVFLEIWYSREQQLECRLMYHSLRIDEDIASSLIDTFLAVLKESSQSPLTQLSLVRLSNSIPWYIDQLNNTMADYPCTKTVHDCFDETVQKYPHRIALEDGEWRQISYTQLKDLSESLAGKLYNSGIRSGESLGFLVSRSIPCIAAVISALRMGCCYVHLNTSLPNERLKYQAGMCSITHFLCDIEGERRLSMENVFPNSVKETSWCHEGLMLYKINSKGHCDGGEHVFSEINEDPLPHREDLFCVSPETLAYTMFTSGTTGLPKGVDISHRNIVNLATNFNHINYSDETGLLHSPLSFDGTTFEIWAILLNGGKLVIAPPTRLSSEDIVNLIVARKITQLFLTTGLFHVVVAHHCHLLQNVRHIVVSGDVMVPELARRAVTNLKTTAVYNNYGPTETTAFCTVYKVPKEYIKMNMGFVPIGAPVKNARMYLLDKMLNPVPLGVPGDLYIGGDGVGIGYKTKINSEAYTQPPEWTKLHFSESGKLYKTGDTARCILDPITSKVVIQYLGRTDTQTKIEGFRIELKECESWILKHPLVQSVSVIAEDDSADKRKLVAYVVLSESVTVDELRQFSMKHLPAYGVPSKWYSVDAVPLDNNGKVSYRDLPKMQKVKPTIPFKEVTMGKKRATRKEEQILARIWSEEIQVPLENIDVQTNYFEIGGTSLIALHIMARITREMNRKISNSELVFNKPVFGEFAKDVLSSASVTATQTGNTIQTSPFDPFVLSWQQQKIFDFGKLKISTRADKIYAAVKLPTKLNFELLEQSINRVIEKNRILHTLYNEVDSKPCRIPSILMCKIAVIRRKPVGFLIEDAPDIIAADSGKELNIKRGPLMKCTLYEFDKTEHSVLHFIAHHITIDNFALWNLISNILSYYENPGECDLGKSGTVSYDNFAEEQQKQLEHYAAAQSFWGSKMLNSSLNPFDIPEVDVKVNMFNHEISSLPFRMSKCDVAAISQEHGVSHMCVILAAYYLALCDVTGKKAISIASPFANRNSESMQTIGPTVNRLILKLDALDRGSITTVALLHNVTQEILSCMAYQHTPVRCEVPLVGFNYFSTANNHLPLGGEVLYVPICNSPNDNFVWMVITELHETIHCQIQYKSNILKSETIQNLGERFISHLISFKTNDRSLIQSRDQELRKKVWTTSAPDIESILLAEKQIIECHVVHVTVNAGIKVCAFIKTNSPFQEINDICSQRLRSRGFYGILISLVVTIPRNKDGDVDEHALSKCLVVDDNTCKTIKDRLYWIYSTPGISVTCTKRPLKASNVSPVSKPSQELSNRYQDVMTNGLGFGHVSDDKSGRVSAPEKQVDDLFSDPNVTDDLTEIPSTMTEALFATAKKFPNKGIHIISQDSPLQILSYQQLLKEALQVSAGLQAKNVKAKDFIILHDDCTRAMLPVWWGSALLGAVPVFVSTSPTYKQITCTTDKLHHVWSLLKRPIIICRESNKSNIQSMESFYDDFDANVIASEYLFGCDPLDKEDIHYANPEDLLFIQLSSGSTGVPKCIQESHKAVVQHILLSSEANAYSANDRTLNWLAMDHVVPILTFHLKDTFLGCNQHIVERQVVLKDPFQWLVLMSDYRITHSWSPNFGYAAVVHRLSDFINHGSFPRIDLSCVQILINAGEMVTQNAVAEFVRLTQQFGLSPSVMQPSFGMAEIATCVTYPRGIDYLNSDRWFHRYGSHIFVSLGPPVRGVHIRICDYTTGELLPDGEIGEVEFSCPMVTNGYLFNEAANETLFHGSFLRSGDGGFMKDGCLVLTGRIKEDITIRGNRLFCHEIEEAVAHIDGVKPTYVACCGVSCSRKGTEGMVVFLCVNEDRDNAAIAMDVKMLVNKRFGILPDEVVVVNETQFLKTTSGKIRRLAMKELYLKGLFKISHRVESLQLLTKVLEPAKLRSRSLPTTQTAIIVVRRPQHSLSLAVVNRLNEQGFKVCVLNVQTSQCYTSEKIANKIQVFTLIENAALLNMYEEVLKNAIGFTGYVDYCVNFLYLASSSRCAIGDELVSIGNGNHQFFDLLTTLVKVCTTSVKFVNIIDNLDKDPYKSFAAVLQSAMAEKNELITAVDVQLTAPFSLTQVGDIACSEIFSLEKDDVVVYDNGSRHVPRYHIYRQDNIQDEAIQYEGTYIVSGGFGDISQQLIRFLHSNYRARMIVIGMRNWGESHAQAWYKSLLQDGVELFYISGDMGCSNTFKTLIQKARSKWPTLKSVDGAFHLPCSSEEMEIQHLSTDAINTLVRENILGAVHLREFLKEQNNDTLLVLLLLASPKHHLAVSSANAFLEGFSTCSQTERSKNRVVCFNWSLWEGLHNRGNTNNEDRDSASTPRFDLVEGFKVMIDNLAATQPLIIGLTDSRLVRSASTPFERERLSDIVLQIQIDVTPGTSLPRSTDVLQTLTENDLTDAVGNPLRPEHVSIGIGYRNMEALDVTDTPTLPPNVIQIKDMITEQWGSVLNISTKSMASENFFEMGGESIDIPNLVTQLRDVMEVEISAADIYQYQTISELAEYLASIKDARMPMSLAKEKQTIWFQAKPLHQPKNPVKAKLFCFPHIGSSYSCFSGWSFPDVETWFTIYPYEPHSWKDLIQSFAVGIVDIIGLAPDTPFILFGHSFAALLAYEVYQYMREKGHRSPSLMIVSGMHSPLGMELRRPSVQTWNKDEETDENYLKTLEQAGFEIDDILMDRASTDTVTEQLIGQIRYLFHLYEIYKCRHTDPVIYIPVAVLGSRDDTFVTLDELQTWKDVCSEPMNIVEFPGGHCFVYHANSLVFAKIINCIFAILDI